MQTQCGDASTQSRGTVMARLRVAGGPSSSLPHPCTPHIHLHPCKTITFHQDVHPSQWNNRVSRCASWHHAYATLPMHCVTVSVRQTRFGGMAGYQPQLRQPPPFHRQLASLLNWIYILSLVGMLPFLNLLSLILPTLSNPERQSG